MQIIFNSLEEMASFWEKVNFKGEIVKEEIPPKKEEKKEEMVKEEEVPPAEPETTYTLVEVRAKLSELTKNGKKAQVKELLNSFGVEKLVNIKEEDYPELMKKAGEL